MANKKNVIAQKHREAITQSALELFAQKGYEKVTMDDVAKQGDYSKRTVYEYFKSKDEIYFAAVLRSFASLLEAVQGVCEKPLPEPFDHFGKNSQTVPKKKAKTEVKQRFLELCSLLAALYQKNPLVFDAGVQFSSLPKADSPDFVLLTEIYELGEKINSVVAGFLQQMIEAEAVKKDLPVIPTIFMLWSSLSGIIKMALVKQAYLTHAAHMDHETFLQYSFELLYRSIAR